MSNYQAQQDMGSIAGFATSVIFLGFMVSIGKSLAKDSLFSEDHHSNPSRITTLQPDLIPEGKNNIIRLYHGTRIDKNTILYEGLKRPSYNRLLDETLSRYGYTREDVPEDIWRAELNYRLEEYKRYSPKFQSYIAFTLNRAQAKQYALMGGEFTYVIIFYLFRWQGYDAKIATEKALEGRGKPKIVTVNVPKQYVPRDILEKIRKLKELGYDMEKCPWSIPVFRDIPPNWIVNVEEVEEVVTLGSKAI